MKGENGIPTTPEWHLPARATCTAHGALCETPQHCTWLRGEPTEEHIVRGDE